MASSIPFAELRPVGPELIPRVQEAADRRVGHLLHRFDGRPFNWTLYRVALVGFPVDEGIRRNQGRAGAAQAPSEIRRWLYRMTPASASSVWERTMDLGDLSVGTSLEADRERLAALIAALLAEGLIPIVLGGGHETAFGHFLGYVRSGRRVSLLNVDQHLDVRPLREGRPHSGSPFREALEHPAACVQQYRVLGAQRQAVSEHHVAYVRERGGLVHWWDALMGNEDWTFLDETPAPILVSFDLDSIRQADAPGVSAPSPVGLSAEWAVSFACRCGRHPAVSSFELVECSPPLDRDGQTARLSALILWSFVQGLAARWGRG
ncbi:MAG: formimidoylglutamase [Bacteroidetes bacterium]|nr:formimidoylglutamase [Rhodothermia bacterium]MCS7154421.1 formimidoylglutamase [Bacteroidota bacterium]MCX7906794.1 formimidoylglutamase [Bacteroidota bacterium]MDW8136927.1 formimidoylglutamase [Bacteroidota bacterium]MDW8285203.1 formimidoylglutamase [Bacteroidota bacterium]